MWYGPIIRGTHDEATGYVSTLVALSEDIPTLQRELESIRNLYPHFSYEYQGKREYNPLTRMFENTISDNPYNMAFEQFANQNLEKLSPQAIFNEGQKIFSIVPRRWQDTYLRGFIDWSERILGSWTITQGDREKVAKILNRLISAPTVSETTLNRVATNYFYNSLLPETRNAEFALYFLEKNADKIAPRNSQEGVSSYDSLLFAYVQQVGDIYRYDLNGEDAEYKRELGRKDLRLALQAAKKISDPKVKDLSLENLVYAFTDADYHDLEIAKDLIELMSDPNIQQNAQEEIRLEMEREEKGNTMAWKKIEKIRRHAAENMQLLVGLLGFSTEEEQRRASDVYSKKTSNYPAARTAGESSKTATQSLEAEVERISQAVGITLNMSWEALTGMLNLGRVKSIWENAEEMERRNKTMDYHYGVRRDTIERHLGNRAKGGASDPHPIYGAVFSPNGRDEFFGAAFRYGECFIKLKNEKVRERTTITYDDSFNGFNDFPLLWEHAAIAKSMMNLTDHGTRHGYVEAQILGGVTLDDIESITIPKLVLQEVYKKSGQAGVDRVLDQINEMREKFPGISIIIAEEASASKMIELLSSYFHEPEIYLEARRKYFEELEIYVKR